MPVSFQERRNKHIPEEKCHAHRRDKYSAPRWPQNGGQFFSITILLTVDAGVFQMGKLDEPFSALCKIPAGNYQLCFAAAVPYSFRGEFPVSEIPTFQNRQATYSLIQPLL